MVSRFSNHHLLITVITSIMASGSLSINKTENQELSSLDINQQEKAYVNCTMYDHIHFRKIEFWSNSLIARELVQVQKLDLEVYMSFCLPLPLIAFQKCKITSQFDKYFYIQIQNGMCKSVLFKDIKNFVYEKVQKAGISKAQNQITVEFLLDTEEHSITFPDFQIKNVELLNGKAGSVMLRLPLGD